jgi:hypothetical protein
LYVTTLKLALAVALVVHAALVVGLAVAGRPVAQAAEMFTNYPNAALTIFFWVTAAFALLDFAIARVRIDEKWDPRTLPPVRTTAPHASRLEVGFELVIGALFILWWTTVARAPEFVFGPARSFLSLGPAWLDFYAPVLTVALASLVAKSIMLVRPDWVTFRLVTGVVMSVAALVLMGLLLRAGDLVVPASGSAEAAALARVANMGLRVSFVVASMIIVAATIVDVRRFMRGRPTHPVSA